MAEPVRLLVVLRVAQEPTGLILFWVLQLLLVEVEVEESVQTLPETVVVVAGMDGVVLACRPELEPPVKDMMAVRTAALFVVLAVAVVLVR